MTGGFSGRYIVPSFTERTSYGIKEMNPYNKLFEERVIFLGAQIDDTSANDIIAQLFTLETVNPDADINLYINSPGGAYTSMTAIYDTMQFVCCDIQTVCVGQARSAAAILLAAGTAGKRIALPHSRIVLEQPTIASEYGQASDIEIQSQEAPSDEGGDGEAACRALRPVRGADPQGHGTGPLPARGGRERVWAASTPS